MTLDELKKEIEKRNAKVASDFASVDDIYERTELETLQEEVAELRAMKDYLCHVVTYTGYVGRELVKPEMDAIWVLSSRDLGPDEWMCLVDEFMASHPNRDVYL